MRIGEIANEVSGYREGLSNLAGNAAMGEYATAAEKEALDAAESAIGEAVSALDAAMECLQLHHERKGMA